MCLLFISTDVRGVALEPCYRHLLFIRTFYQEMSYGCHGVTRELVLPYNHCCVSCVCVCVHVCLGRELIIPGLGVDYSDL